MGISFRVSEYVRPETMDQALSLVSKFGKKGKIIAGGTNVLVEKPAGVEALIDITRLNLKHIATNGNGLKIGALATVADVQVSPLLKGPYSILREAAKSHGHALVRHLATIGGNICKAHPALDFSPPLLALDAQVKINGQGGERSMPLEEFFLDFEKTALGDDEIVTEFILPAAVPGAEGVFLKMAWTRVEIALINTAIVITLSSDNTCQDARIALGTAAPVPFRSKKAESVLKGKRIDDSLMKEAAEIASDESKPENYFRASEAYKRHIIKVFVERALAEALRRAKGGR
jgi:carbon-monoxide dehydrogenase medium subunit